jgi:hypothetical protein
MVRWSGFADLVFAESAWHAFARAAELADTDVHEQHQDAWIIEDQHLSFSLQTETTRASVDAMKRFLSLLALQAQEGEATIEVAEPPERWLRRAASSSGMEELTQEDGPPLSTTIRVAGQATG